ncbi:MAG: CDP-alcohol phosphatidyltransferase family protein [Silicimonas sp.]|nr:CDP-alcohol phosphatidyltransferase family protein [Silicimonas sp.]
MDIKTKAYSVHMLTASGAVFAMLALLDAAKGEWAMMFVWLMVAFAVDGLDGPLARKTEVTVNAARLDGTVLDTIIDYLTYVIIPAFALFQSGLLPGWTGWVAIIAITFLSAIYFADTSMKTKDYSFSGFPACWNMVVLVLFAIKPDFWISLIIVLVLAVVMLLPIKFVHPFRTERWRLITLPMAFGWTFFAIWAAWVDFHPQSWAHWGLIITTLWLMLAGVVQQVLFKEEL